MEAGHDKCGQQRKVVTLRSEDPDVTAFNPCDACPTFEQVQRLRELLRNSMLQPQQELDEACLMIAGYPQVSIERVAAAFFHGLSRYAKRRMVFFNAKAASVSSGEQWVARLLQVVAQDDIASARYLIESTIEPAGRRWMLFLARELAAHLMPAVNDNQTSRVDTQPNSKES